MPRLDIKPAHDESTQWLDETIDEAGKRTYKVRDKTPEELQAEADAEAIAAFLTSNDQTPVGKALAALIRAAGLD